MSVSYEWVVEEIDEAGDIINVNHPGAFADALKETRATPERFEIALVRNEGDEGEGLRDRQWAYIKDGALPEFFDNTQIKVPVKYRGEVAKEAV